MRLTSFPAALCMAATAVPAAAQVTAPPVVPGPPPIIVMRPPADPYASLVKAKGQWNFEGQSYALEFLVDGKLAALRLRDRMTGVQNILPLSSPADFLGLLADRKVDFLWPAIAEWVGPSMERLRSNLLEAAKQGYDSRSPVFFANNTAESVMRAPARAVSQYARALERTGDGAAAVDVLRREASTRDLKTDWGRGEYSVLWAQMAGVLHTRGQSDAALAELSTGLAALGGSRYAGNLAITRAAVLAESGRYEEALVAINQLGKEYKKTRGKVAGSDRQFAWIRACALQGLGRTADAKRAFPDLQNRPEPVDKDWIVPANASIQIRALTCLGDVEGLVMASIAELEGGRLTPRALLLLQPDYAMTEGGRRVWAEARRDPRLIAAAQGRFRQLPPEYAPALRSWRPEPDSTAAN